MFVFLGTRPDGVKNAWWPHPELTLQASVLYVCTDFSVNFANSPPKILSIILQFLAPLKYIGVRFTNVHQRTDKRSSSNIYVFLQFPNILQ